MFDRFLDARSQLAFLCLITALVYWQNDLLFFTFATMAFFTRAATEPRA